MNEVPITEIKTIRAWMREQMYDLHTEWTYGNEHDAMLAAYDFLGGLLPDEEEE